MTKFINLFGGPGTGKSTAAAGVFTYMKRLGYNVELVTEVAKDFIWEDRSTTMSIQPYITIKQYRNLYRLKGKVDYVITDAPILMGIVYANRYAPSLPKSYRDFIYDLHKQELNPSINLYLERVFDYDKNGRYQPEEEALEIDAAIRDLLNSHSPGYHTWDPRDIEGLHKNIENDWK